MVCEMHMTPPLVVGQKREHHSYSWIYREILIIIRNRRAAYDRPSHSVLARLTFDNDYCLP